MLILNHEFTKTIEEVINITKLMRHFDEVLERSRGAKVIEEIVLQSRI